jgi:hypothetical protein
LENVGYIYIFLTVVLFSALLIVSFFIKHIFPYIATLYTALSIGFIIQGNFVNYNLGALDGHTISWSTFTQQKWLELTLWVILISAFLVFRRFLYHRLSLLVVFVLIYQSASLLSTIISTHLPGNIQSYYLDGSKEFEFSDTKNVMLIILDTFRSEYFTQILQKYPEYRDVFKDFEFYTDAVGGYPTTLPSVPLALTGKYYDNSIPISEFISKYQNESLPALLKANGYSIENYPFVPFYAQIFDNYSRTMPDSNKISMAIQQYYVTGIRYMPLILKPYFVNQYYDGLDYYHKDMVDFEDRVGETKAVNSPPTFKLIHLSGAHPPLQLDKDLNRTDKGFIEQATACLKIVADLLAQLKRVGAYDNALIVIIGDHGTEQPWDYQGDPLVYSTQPLILTKRQNQHSDEIKYSNNKVATSDIPKSIADELNIKNSFDGYSIFSSIPSDRIRYWYYYEWTQSDWTTAYLPTMYKFDISGPSALRSSYKFTDIKPGNNESDQNKYLYHYGDNIVTELLSDNSYRSIFSTNFSYETKDDVSWSWASGPGACIYLIVTQTDQPLELSIRSDPYLVISSLDTQTMKIRIDQQFLGSFTNDGNLDFTIPSDVSSSITSDQTIDLCFEFPDAVKSPKEYGVSDDGRLLGYRFTSITIK